jgi:hypothetical protein
MSEIIYLKDILRAKVTTNTEKKHEQRPRMKTCKCEKIIKSSLIEKEKKENRRGTSLKDVIDNLS